jgi:hypothetical protein
MAGTTATAELFKHTHCFIIPYSFLAAALYSHRRRHTYRDRANEKLCFSWIIFLDAYTIYIYPTFYVHVFGPLSNIGVLLVLQYSLAGQLAWQCDEYTGVKVGYKS